jgi:PEP-CTERM motif-containing protein
MQRIFGLAAAAALLLTGVQASGQSVTFDFESGGDQGWGNKFSNDASATFPTPIIAGSRRLEVLRNGDFQEADINSSSNPYLAAFNAAVANPSGYLISYDWYVNTAPGNYGSFLQVGTYINGGQGTFPYVQDFPGTGKDVELSGVQLASGGVFSGTVTETLTAKYGALHADFLNAPSQRLGFIINGDGANATVYFDNVRIRPIPEPASIALFGMAASALWMMRRRSPR